MAVQPESKFKSLSFWYNLLLSVFFSLFLIAFIAIVLFLFFLSVKNEAKAPGGSWIQALTGITRWFDPVFFQYNLFLLLFAVLIVPAITVFYLINMRGEKERRLRADIPPEIWDQEEKRNKIQETIARAFELRNYFGSMVTLAVITMLGCGIITLLKPLPLSGEGSGVDYTRGVNFLMLGPFMELFLRGETQRYIPKLMVSLTAFQFGFLGAYLYFIGHLVRSYFTLDLTPHTFVESSVRMVRGAVMALILSFGLQQWGFFQSDAGAGERFLGWLPLVSFFFGFYPSRAILVIEKLAIRVVNLKEQRYFSTPLTKLPGMSYSHEIQLHREGFDNVENLLRLDAINLAIRTGFSYRQLIQWKRQALLLVHLGADYHHFWQATGISSWDELADFLNRPNGSVAPADACEPLMKAVAPALRDKLRILCAMVAISPVPAEARIGFKPDGLENSDA
ncbi:MAG: hypothetical protein R6X05_17175 [Desulfobacterales bacterium]